MQDKVNDMYLLLKELFPICRSITGNGVRKTLSIINNVIPLNVYEIPSGTRVFDWEIPLEWNIKDAYIKDSSGTKIVDFQKSNLHVMGYSEPFSGTMSLSELKPHLFSAPNTPDWVPYVTSYYKRRWGFCITDRLLKSLKEDMYIVNIDSSLEKGSMTYADLVIKGEVEQEVLISTYICHPSMANNELSGPVIATYIAKELLGRKKPYYTYRFVFVPETIGAITYIHNNLDVLKNNVFLGYIITCAGDDGKFSYLESKNGVDLVDRVSKHVLGHSTGGYNSYSFRERGSDERQYSSPGIGLSVGSIMRSKYYEYPEYHTSADNLDFVTSEGLSGTLEMYIKCINVIERNRTYINKVMCEPKMDKIGMYPDLSIGVKDTFNQVRDIRDVLMYSDGTNDLLDIANLIEVPVWNLFPIVDKLLEHNILEEIC